MKKSHAELKKKSASDLEKELASTKLEIMKLQSQISTGTAAKEVGKYRNLKKKIARIMTLQRGGGN